MLPLLCADQLRNCSRGNDVIAQEILILSLRAASVACNAQFSVVSQHDTTVIINGVPITGSIMTNDDAIGHEYYSVAMGQADDPVKAAQIDAVKTYFTSYGYTLDLTSANGTSLTWTLSW